MRAQPLSKRRQAVYALGDHTVNAALSALSFFYFFFLTETAGLGPALAGLVPWAGRVIDAFTDPIMGRISDHTRWRWGRRRPYFLLGALPFGISFAALWMDVPLHSELARFGYYAAVYVAFGIGATIVSVPYLALIPELARGYDERTSINTWRSAGSMLGVFVALGLWKLAHMLGGDRQAFSWAGGLIAVWLTLPWIAVYAASFERPEFRRPTQVRLGPGLRVLVRHRAYRVLTGLFLLSRIAVDLVTALLVFYFQHWLHRPGDFLLTMVLFVTSLVVALPAWLLLSHHVDKRTLFALGAGFWFVVQAGFFFATPGWPPALVFSLGALAGVGYAAVEMMPWSMLGDVVDEDELMVGERREGLYTGFFTFLRKLSGPSAVLLAGLALKAAGMRAGGVTPPEAVFTIRLLASAAPAFFLAAAVALAFRYPLSRAQHAAVVEQLAARSGARDGPASSP